MVLEPLPLDERMKSCLIIHELWHQHESKLRLYSPCGPAVHLDEEKGRTLIFLEWNALMEALSDQGIQRRQMISDALSFRKLRFEAYPSGIKPEVNDYLHEGLAEYTGMTLCGWDRTGKMKYLKERLRDTYFNRASLIAIYSYMSGPLYGLLMDEAEAGWTRNIREGDDIGELIAVAYRVTYFAASEDSLKVLALPYGYDSIHARETTRSLHTRMLADGLRKRFIEGKIIFLPGQNLKIQYDPHNVVPLDSMGSVYGSLKEQADWGSLNIDSGGVLLLEDWKGLLIDVPVTWKPAERLSVPNGELILNENYDLKQPPRGWAVCRKQD
jgi:hypothetical protein